MYPLTRLAKYRLAYLLFRLKHEIFQPFISLTSYCSAKLWGVKVDSRVSFLGVPRFRNLGVIEIGEGTRIISDNRNVVGAEVKTFFQTGVNGRIIIGKNTGISNCAIIAQNRIKIGDQVFVGGGVRIYDNDFHSTNPEIRLFNPEVIPSAPVEIKSRAFIGGHSLILKGVVIGENAVVGAGSVVTKSIGDNEIWAGVPAKKIGEVK